MIKVTNAHFLQSCERFSQAPSILGAEIAILGRSNVGKSSLINALLNHKNLAKSSATPGKTRLINFFSAKWRVDCALDSANKKNLSLRADSQNLGGNISSLRNFAKQSCGKPPCEKMQDLQGGWLLRNARKSYGLPREQSSLAMTDFGGLPRRFCESARNDEILDSSLRLRSAQNDKVDCHADSANLLAMTENNDFAESSLDSATRTKNAESANKAQQTIEAIAVEVAEFLGDFECKTGLKSAQCSKSPKSPQDAPKSKLREFEIRILDFPGFGYARVSKAEKSSWDRHLSEFLHKRDSIKLYLHLIDARHQNLAIDNEIFAFLNRFKRGDSAILQVFTKADKLGKNELTRLKKQHKFYHAINDKNSTEILRRAILKILYNVDF